ncbi:Iron-sulfur clusters transporter atm1 [Diplonema papillatum]|nr:Iron-sulfur clusters transporter atm1 [Diplonema papillatum]
MNKACAPHSLGAMSSDELKLPSLWVVGGGGALVAASSSVFLLDFVRRRRQQRAKRQRVFARSVRNYLQEFSAELRVEQTRAASQRRSPSNGSFNNPGELSLCDSEILPFCYSSSFRVYLDEDSASASGADVKTITLLGVQTPAGGHRKILVRRGASDEHVRIAISKALRVIDNELVSVKFDGIEVPPPGLAHENLQDAGVYTVKKEENKRRRRQSMIMQAAEPSGFRYSVGVDWREVSNMLRKAIEYGETSDVIEHLHELLARHLLERLDAFDAAPRSETYSIGKGLDELHKNLSYVAELLGERNLVNVLAPYREKAPMAIGMRRKNKRTAAELVSNLEKHLRHRSETGWSNLYKILRKSYLQSENIFFNSISWLMSGTSGMLQPCVVGLQARLATGLANVDGTEALQSMHVLMYWTLAYTIAADFFAQGSKVLHTRQTQETVQTLRRRCATLMSRADQAFLDTHDVEEILSTLEADIGNIGLLLRYARGWLVDVSRIFGSLRLIAGTLFSSRMSKGSRLPVITAAIVGVIAVEIFKWLRVFASQQLDHIPEEEDDVQEFVAGGKVQYVSAEAIVLAGQDSVLSRVNSASQPGLDAMAHDEHHPTSRPLPPSDDPSRFPPYILNKPESDDHDSIASPSPAVHHAPMPHHSIPECASSDNLSTVTSPSYRVEQGDIGIVLSVDLSGSKVKVRFPAGDVTLTENKLRLLSDGTCNESAYLGGPDIDYDDVWEAETFRVARLCGKDVEEVEAALATKDLQVRKQSEFLLVPGVTNDFLVAVSETVPKLLMVSVALFLFKNMQAHPTPRACATAFTAGAQLLMLEGEIEAALSGINRIQAEIRSLIHDTFVGARRTLYLLSYTPMIEAEDADHTKWAPSKSQVKGEIVFDNVTFAYPSSPEVAVLREASFTIPAGSHVAIVGPSGCGKSSLFMLLSRLYDPQAGRILLDGVDLRDHDAKHLRKNLIGIAVQDPYLFDGTLQYNIKYACPNASRDEVRQALATAACDRVVERLPEKLLTVIGGGTKLSGGEQKRIGLARTFLPEPPVLLLDEPTAGLDASTEKVIKKKLLRHQRRTGATVVTISHSLALIQDCDRIFVFGHPDSSDAGRLIASGTHDDLMVSCSEYESLAVSSHVRSPGIASPSYASEDAESNTTGSPKAYGGNHLRCA